ncbi:hypothetical protein [Streptomyces sp. NPDC088557]|uniref:hypothetical protein n=1 Tax=Streptomyces sp. NPDC088557 TaxID=3365867 RepID=UPI0037FAFA23
MALLDPPTAPSSDTEEPATVRNRARGVGLGVLLVLLALLALLATVVRSGSFVTARALHDTAPRSRPPSGTGSSPSSRSPRSPPARPGGSDGSSAAAPPPRRPADLGGLPFLLVTSALGALMLLPAPMR